MIKIAICDDENGAVLQHEAIVKNSLQSCSIGYEIVIYTRSNNLLSDIADDNFFYDFNFARHRNAQNVRHGII